MIWLWCALSFVGGLLVGALVQGLAASARMGDMRRTIETLAAKLHAAGIDIEEAMRHWRDM